MRNLTTWVDAQITAVKNLTPTVREIQIAAPDLGASAPGAHVNIQVLINGRPDHRSYSVVRPLDSGGVVIAVKRVPDSRGGSAYMWGLEAGARVKITPPACDFELSLGAPDYLLVAGGIGITPIIRMAEVLVARGHRLRMIYATRSREELAYLEPLKELLGAALIICVADEGVFLNATEEIGKLEQNGELYICGPLGLMDVVRKAWTEHGRNQANIHYETFGSSGRHPAQEFTVRVPRLGVEVVVPKDRSMLDVLNEVGVEVLSDCRRGECGLCALDINAVAGEIDHRDVFFSEEQHAESKRMCACVSRVAGGCVTIDPAWRGDPVLR
ncbi:PDR/VanB family oxidoreductase [Pseudomonas sp. NGC7]|uniref:PDR/VanB family oxidoreductase n=1 Tax=Pseudomonas sp. NGC7 TaxID=3341775 RepID=UPI0037DB4E30